MVKLQLVDRRVNLHQLEVSGVMLIVVRSVEILWLEVLGGHGYCGWFKVSGVTYTVDRRVNFTSLKF